MNCEPTASNALLRTGVLLKLYLPEPRAADAVAFVNANPGKPPVNPLHELEMRSALRQKASRGELTQTECDALSAQVESDLATAEALSAAHGVATLCRSLDTLHVALALELGATEFCTFGLRQSRMATAAGLRVVS